MQNLSRLQQVFAVLFLVLGGIWLCLSVAPSLIAYRGGDGALAGTLKVIAPFFGVGALGVLFALLAISRFTNPAQPGVEPAAPAAYGGRSLKNLAVWMVIAILLVFLFNVFQGGGSGPHRINSGSPPHDDLATILVNMVPILLMVGFWFFIMRQMRARNRDKDKP